jgi:lipoic acid synthetase
MILGEVYTRACRYCSVTSGRPEAIDVNEPGNVAEAVARLELGYAVITSVDRDDLPLFGADHFAATVHAVRDRSPECKVEVLVPEFGGSWEHQLMFLESRPDTFGHNTETVPRLFSKMRSRGDYDRTLEFLALADEYRRKHDVPMNTKTGVMVGLGESIDEVLEVMDDLRSVNVDVLTLGQYLNPTKKHAPIARFYDPQEFVFLKEQAFEKGFKHCESGPLVRSSYHAHEHVPGAPAALRR